MKIVICGSMSFSAEMIRIGDVLMAAGHSVILPDSVEEYAGNADLLARASGWGTVEGAERKIANDLIKEHFHAIEQGDAILVVNGDKNGIKNYLGGIAFWKWALRTCSTKNYICSIRFRPSCHLFIRS